MNLRLITGFAQYQGLYGGFIEGSNLAYAVDGFFRNGGQRCYIGRIVGKGSKTASADLVKAASPPAPATPAPAPDIKTAITVSALGPGDWGTRIAVKVDNASLTTIKPKLFKLTVAYWNDTPPEKLDDNTAKTATILESYDNLSLEPSSSDYYLNRINGISNLITLDEFTNVDIDAMIFLKLDPAGAKPSGAVKLDKVETSDYTGITDPGKRTGFAALEEQEDISIVCIPDENSIKDLTLTSALVDHCENMKDRFAICQASQTASDISKLIPPRDSKYAAFYYPWITIIDPVTNMKKLIPPGGHIAGVYARSDSERGVHKAPANEILQGAVDLQINLTKGDQDILNPRGVNCIRAFVGRGIRIWGARTASTDPSWKYLNVRRLFIFMEKSIDIGTQWVVFEPNDEKLWARVKQTISQFLVGVWKDGALMGTTQDEAFFVKCDRTTMTQDDIDNGKLIILVGVAPVKPAEFVIFRIAQVAKGSQISE